MKNISVLRAETLVGNNAAWALARAAESLGISTDCLTMSHELRRRGAEARDVVRAAIHLGLNARLLKGQSVRSLDAMPRPVIICLRNGAYAILGKPTADRIEVIYGDSAQAVPRTPEEISNEWTEEVVLISRCEKGGTDIDYGFTSLANSLLTTPASPVGLWLIVIISIVLLLSLFAACIVKSDIYAFASTQILPVGRSKIIQPLEISRVRSVRVTDGSFVHKGDLLIELDPTATEADRDTSAVQIDSLDGEIARRMAAIAAASTQKFSSTGVSFGSGISSSAQERESAVFRADLENLKMSLASLDAQLAEDVAQEKASELTLTEQQKLVETLRNRLEMHRTLRDQGYDSKESLMGYEQNFAQAMTTLANLEGAVLHANASRNTVISQKKSAVAKFIADNTAALESAQERRAQLRESLIKASARYADTHLIAPISGTVQELSVTTIGQVVTQGQQLLTIVPDHPNLEAEAMVENKDIGFVAIGQRVVIKLDAFPFTRYGTISGRITFVSHQAVSSHDSPNATLGSLKFPVRIALDRTSLTVAGREAPLVSGMRGTADIRTGTRLLIDYLVSPIREVASDSAHER